MTVAISWNEAAVMRSHYLPERGRRRETNETKRNVLRLPLKEIDEQKGRGGISLVW